VFNLPIPVDMNHLCLLKTRARKYFYNATKAIVLMPIQLWNKRQLKLVLPPRLRCIQDRRPRRSHPDLVCDKRGFRSLLEAKFPNERDGSGIRRVDNFLMLLWLEVRPPSEGCGRRRGRDAAIKFLTPCWSIRLVQRPKDVSFCSFLLMFYTYYRYIAVLNIFLMKEILVLVYLRCLGITVTIHCILFQTWLLIVLFKKICFFKHE